MLLKNVYNAEIKNIEDKLPNITNSPTNNTLNAKIYGIKNDIPSIINLATNVALSIVENSQFIVSDLVKKADYGAKILQMEKQSFTTTD